MPVPLPDTESALVQRIADEDPNYLNAYNVCLTYEQELAGNMNKQRHVRILGYLLLHAPNHGVRAEVSKCIHSRKGTSDLSDVGAYFERNLIFVFKRYKSRTPKSSRHPSRDSFEHDKDDTKSSITEAHKPSKDARLKVLKRDSWRCVATGEIDLEAPKDILTQLGPEIATVPLQCAHIIPESLFFGLEPKSEENYKLDYSATVLTMLKQFCIDIDKFNGGKVHSSANLMTLNPVIHELFDRLQLYFEATSEKDRYEIKYFTPHTPHTCLRRFVTFTTTDPEKYPVPAPELLALHATCCKVAYFSGSAEYFDTIDREADGLSILSADGGSADVLSALLSRKIHPNL